MAPKPSRPRSDPLPSVGWREWIALPELGVPYVKAKIDTGARTSALHAYAIERFRKQGAEWVRFVVHPLQRSVKESILCIAEVVEEREIRSSTGHTSVRPVIRTPLTVAGRTFSIELTLASRDAMGFRMLLGRQALRGRFTIDPGRSFFGGIPEAVRKKRRARKRKAKKQSKGRTTRSEESR